MYSLSPESTTKPSTVNSSSFITVELVVYVFLFLWTLLGLIAFIYSLYCFGKRGSALDKAVGLILAVLTGPLFFLYLYVNRRYCK